MNKSKVALFIHCFVESKYKNLIAHKVIEDAVIEYPDGRFGFNCHAVLEKYGIGIDQFKKDFADLLLIFNRT